MLKDKKYKKVLQHLKLLNKEKKELKVKMMKISREKITEAIKETIEEEEVDTTTSMETIKNLIRRHLNLSMKVINQQEAIKIRKMPEEAVLHHYLVVVHSIRLDNSKENKLDNLLKMVGKTKVKGRDQKEYHNHQHGNKSHHHNSKKNY